MLTTFVSLFGLLIAVASLAGLVRRHALMNVVNKLWRQPWSMALAVAIRIAMGVVLIVAAPDTRFPLTILVVGWLVIAGAIALPFIGHQRLTRLIQWFDDGPGLVSAWLAVGLLFGLALIYAARCAPLAC